MTDTFTATCTCPACGLVATHLTRPPNPEPLKRIREPSTWEVVQWGGDTVIEHHDAGLDRFDERPYETIRTCVCGNEWGQA